MEARYEGTFGMGGNGAQSFYRRDELSRRKAIRSELVRFHRSVFFRGKTVATLPFFFPGLFSLALVCGHDKVTYVSRYRSYPPLRRRSSFPLVLSDDPIPSPTMK